MKNGSNNKKPIIAACLVLASVFLCGSIFYTPVLKNADLPFIELSGSVGTAIGNAKQAYEDEHKPVEETSKKDDKSKEKASDSAEKTSDSNITITVSNKEIKVGMLPYHSFDDFESTIRSGAYDGQSFVVEDNYANYKVFKRVLGLLDKMGKKYTVKTVTSDDDENKN